jgi:hypothetical protein
MQRAHVVAALAVSEEHFCQASGGADRPRVRLHGGGIFLSPFALSATERLGVPCRWNSSVPLIVRYSHHSGARTDIAGRSLASTTMA